MKEEDFRRTISSVFTFFLRAEIAVRRRVSPRFLQSGSRGENQNEHKGASRSQRELERVLASSLSLHFFLQTLKKVSQSFRFVSFRFVWWLFRGSFSSIVPVKSSFCACAPSISRPVFLHRRELRDPLSRLPFLSAKMEGGRCIEPTKGNGPRREKKKASANNDPRHSTFVSKIARDSIGGKKLIVAILSEKRIIDRIFGFLISERDLTNLFLPNSYITFECNYKKNNKKRRKVLEEDAATNESLKLERLVSL